MSILHLAANRKQIKKTLLPFITAVLFLMLCVAGVPQTAVAAGIGDVVTQVAKANYASPEFEFGAEKMTGLSIKMHAGYGGSGNGYGGVTVLGPADATGMQNMLKYVDSQTNHTNIHTKKMKGCEVREYTMSDGAGVGVILPDYFVTVEFYETGRGNAADIQAALNIAQQTLDGLDRAGLLSQAAPDIQSGAKEPKTSETPAIGTVETAKPLDEPVKVSDTTNIAGVYNGPTVPTTFSINSPHLVTEIHDYHWNNAKGATPGTIGLQDQNGKIFGPWQAVGTPGQGGVPNANWHVYPGIVIPAGTYTVVDSEPSTWSQNTSSGGKGMGYVKATPHFTVTGGSVDGLTTPVPGKGNSSPCDCEKSPAGVGAVGNIPGPSNATEAVVGVAVPGLIATALGALGGLGGGGGLVPPGAGTPLYPNGTGPLPGAGGAPGTASRAPGMGMVTSQIGRRSREEILIDTPDMFETPVPAQEAGVIIDTLHTKDSVTNSDTMIETADEAGVFVRPDPDIFIETAHEELGVILPVQEDGIIIDTPHVEDSITDPGILIETADEAGIFVTSDSDILIDTAPEEPGVVSPGAKDLYDDVAEGEIFIDTSAVEGKTGDGAAPGPKEGIYDREGYDEAGFDRDGFDRNGFDRQGFNKDGFDKNGFDREGYDKSGFDAQGYDKEGFSQAGFDREGYNREGFDQAGFDREGYDVNGYNRSGFDAKGYDKQGFDKEGFNKAGFDREGYDRNGFDKNGWDREGYDKSGFDKEGFDRNGFNREGQSKEGYDADGYDKKGFNEHGYDRDGYDREGFDFEGYNRDGYDPWGYNKQGYGKDGYHWSGYNADGYDRTGRHWSENPYKDSPFDVTVVNSGNPFAENKDVIASVEVELDANGNVIGGRNLADTWKPSKPPLGEPYPRTAEKYGPKIWDDRIPAEKPEKPTIPTSGDSGVIGPEDPMNTLKNHDLGPGREVAPDGQSSSGLSIPEQDIPGAGDIPQETIPDLPPVTGPKHGDTITLPGKDGRDYVLDYNAETGEWENILTGGKIRNEDLESYVRDFNRWQDDVAEDLGRSARDMEKMISRQDATSKAIDEAMGKWKNLEQMQKAADKYGIGEKGGPGDMDKAIQDLKDDMLAGKEVDNDRMEQLKNIIKNRIEGKTTGDSGLRKEEDWVDTLGYALEANLATAKEVVTGEKDDGSTSWLGIGARIMITTATGGVAGKVLDGGLTIAEALSRIKDSVDKGESDFRAVSKAIGLVVLGEEAGWLAGAGASALNKGMLERFPVFTNKAADLVEKALLKGSALNQIWSRKLGLISRESAEAALDQINRRLVDIGGDKAADSIIKRARGQGLSVADSFVDVSKAGKTVAGSGNAAAKGVGKVASRSDEAVKGAQKAAAPKTVSAETPGLKIDNKSFKEAGLPPDLRGMPGRDQKSIRMICDKHGVKAHMRPTNPESKVWLEGGKAHPKPEMLKTKTINDLDVELGYPQENIGTVGCRKPDPLPSVKPDKMTDAHWNSLQKRHSQRMTEYTDQVEKLRHLEQEGKILWDQKTGIIYNKQTMKPYAGDHDAFAFVDAVSGKPVSPRVNEQLNRELQSLGATQHPEHVGWDYSGLSDKVPEGSLPGAQSPREIAEAIDRKILSGHDEGGQALNTYDPLRGEEGGWTTNWWKGGVRE